ncbi:hypothetical protein HDU81_003051 [Chytriomyces hyalinus]|nr:hypothetical protein HDU81_003051 [Chytriomyces hyalinus]
MAAFGEAAHLENLETGAEPKGHVPENMMPLYNALMAIPGLEGSENVAGRLCQAFADRSGDLRTFFKTSVYINQLRNNCSDPTNRAQVLLEIEKWRASDRQMNEHCTKVVMDAFDNLSLEDA